MINFNYSDSQIFKIEKLPQDIQNYIVSITTPAGLEAIVQLSKSFNLLTINRVRTNETFYLDTFAEFVNKYDQNNLIKTTCDLGKKTLSIKSNLKDFKSTIIDTKNEIINQLKLIEIKQLQELNEGFKILSKSHLFKDLIYLATLHHQLEITTQNPPSYDRDTKLISIFEWSCRKEGDLTIAAEAASQISNIPCRNEKLVLVSSLLSQKESTLPLAAETAAKITEPAIRDEKLLQICELLYQKESSIPLTKEVAGKISDKAVRKKAYKIIKKMEPKEQITCIIS